MTNSQIRALSRSNNPDAQDKLRKELSRLSREANKRMSNLEKKGQEGLNKFAYARAKRELKKMGLTKYKSGKNIPLSTITKQLYSANRFLAAKTSTITGQKELRRKAIKNIRNAGVKISYGQEDAFFRFISEDLVQELKDVYDSGRIFQQVMDAINEGKTIQDLEKAWQQYEKGEITADVAWEQWTDVSPEDEKIFKQVKTRKESRKRK